MIGRKEKVFTRDGFLSMESLASQTGSLLVPYRGGVLHITSEVSDDPMMCTPCTVFVCKKQTDEDCSIVENTRAHDIRRGMYLGCPIVTDVPDDDDVLLRQMRCVAGGHPRKVVGKTLDDESCHSDAHIQNDMVWYKIHDIEETEHEDLLYTVPRPSIVRNLMIVA